MDIGDHSIVNIEQTPATISITVNQIGIYNLTIYWYNHIVDMTIDAGVVHFFLLIFKNDEKNYCALSYRLM